MIRFLTCALLWIPSAAYAVLGGAQIVAKKSSTVLAVALDASLQIWNDEAAGIGFGNGQLSSFEMVRLYDNGVVKHDVFIGDGGALDLQILDVDFQPLDSSTPFLFPWSGMVDGEAVTGSLVIFSEIPPEVADEFTEDPTLGTATPQTMTIRWRWSILEGPVKEVTLSTTLQNVESLMQHPALPFAGGISVAEDIGSVHGQPTNAVADPNSSLGFVCACDKLDTICPNAWCRIGGIFCPGPDAPMPIENCRYMWTWLREPPTIGQG